MSVREKMTAIADNIRARAGISGKLNLDQMAAAVDDVYNSGYNAGYDGVYLWASEQYNVGLEDGRRAVWNDIQQGGARENYYHGFYEATTTFQIWTDETFMPIHNMYPTDANGMFRATGITDMPALLERRRVVLDTSRARSLTYFVAYSDYIRKLGVISTLGAAKSGLHDAFSSCTKLQTIVLLILKADGTQTFDRVFERCASLVDITIEGVIGNNIDFSYSPLSVASMKSVILHLMDLNGTGNEYTKLVKFSNACWKTLDADDTAPYGYTWREYVDVLGWNT